MTIFPYEVSEVIHNRESVKLYKFKWNCPKGDHNQGCEVIPSVEKYGGPDVVHTETCGRCGNKFQYKIIGDQNHGYVLRSLEEDKK